jgi:ATP-binding cassette, subfamily C (CFTR/MRP), member 1
MQTLLLILHVVNRSLRTRATITASALTLLDALGLCLLSHSEHIHSVRPSVIINVYLLLTLPFDAARARTLWIGGATKSVAAVFTSSLGIKIMVLITEAIEKRGILLHQYQDSSPEVTSGIYSRSFFWWLNKLMTTGFRRVIQNEDLYPVDEEMSSAFLRDQGHKVWRTSNHHQPRALLWSTLKATRASLAYCIFPRICLIGFRYAQPFLLSRTVNFANSPEQPDSVGWGLTAAFGLIFVGLAVTNGLYQHMSYRFITTVRGTLVTMIYAKTVDLSITALDESAAVTLMASDSGLYLSFYTCRKSQRACLIELIETICQAFATIHEVWAVPIELGIALFLLERQLGLSFLAPAFVAFGSTAGILGLARYIGDAQKIWLEGIQTRVDSTASMLGSMKVWYHIGQNNGAAI